ncbi:hypothetical protein ABB29_13960 [Pseudoxanthomonas dokdonensis]|uniref:Transmembrane protein n=1 Tax=Pseudoxanthomonas dokdonensis TaxID=344882 RepID=A0A0R0CRD5_9GAMM|nr:hypothetical protein ABB29_13960 [Pseudoxanthomonas dokdonensis]
MLLEVAGMAMLGLGIFLYASPGSALARALPMPIAWWLIALGTLQAAAATVLLARFLIGRRAPK